MVSIPLTYVDCVSGENVSALCLFGSSRDTICEEGMEDDASPRAGPSLFCVFTID